MKRTAILLLIILVLISSCDNPKKDPQDNVQKVPQNPLDKIINEEISYSQFSENGFSVLYPNWPNNTQGEVELTVSKGYCTVSINSEKIPAKQWYTMFDESIRKQSGIIIASDQKNLQIKFSSDFQAHSMVSNIRIYECNEKSIAVTITCIEEVKEVMQKLSNKIFPSANCQQKEIKFKDYQDDDFYVSYPEWERITDWTDQRLLGITKGVCSIIVDKHNALPNDVFNWLVKSIEDNDNHSLLTSSIEDNEYNLVYQFPHGKNTLIATTKVFYCNYQSYITQIICVKEYISKHYEKIKNSVLESSRCAKEYEIPTVEKIQEEKKIVKEKEPEIIEEIEDKIVKTNVGQEFGIDEEIVVYFINNNKFLTKVIKDFPKANLLVEDKENNRELKLRALINSDGKITLLEDGEYGNADVTLIIPLRDALNIFSNAENMNPLNLISFAINIRTEPAEIKNQVIQKVLKGEYN